VFLEQMRIHGNDGGVLMIPGSVIDVHGSESMTLTHPISDDAVDEIFTNKAEYIEEMAQRLAPVLAAEKASWAPAEGEPLIDGIRAKFEPIMAQSDLICDGIGYPVGLVMGDETVVLDFPNRSVREPKEGEGKYRYGFRIAPELVRTVLRDDEPDWVNTIFLSTRFSAWRIGGYNEYLYTFFKCLTDERIAYADGWFSEAHDDSASIKVGGYEIQRRCPHLKADLEKFGVVEGNNLTCNLHGWQWDLDSGRCKTTKGHELRARKL
ncbi:MAG: Rieske 2Fe-2S domain-containing protein, partial [Rhodococcus sp.]|nr:Rieske 2Fe-2S domain-containing protein [Rhodococcus sp. (in: high G+C Gram-positive bacteria)]